MNVVFEQDFDSAAIESIVLDADALGGRGLEVILAQNNTGIIRVSQQMGVGTARMIDCSPALFNAFTGYHWRLPVSGNPVTVAFASALLHRGRVRLYDEPFAASGVVRVFANAQVNLGAGAANQLQMTQRSLGRLRRCWIYLNTTRAGHIRCLMFHNGTSADCLNVLGITTATGGFAQLELEPVPDELELYYTNDDGAVANVMATTIWGYL